MTTSIQRIKSNFTSKLKKILGISSVCLAFSLSSSPLYAQEDGDYNLPELGDASSAIVSPQQERALGQEWLRSFRRQVPTSSDPLIYDYLMSVINHLAQYSQLKDKNINLIVVDNPAMNAFAVPGNVMGINTGLFLYSESEAQLSSVVAHELAHLSQRHFARGVEQRQKNSIPQMAAMLASLVIAATAGGDAGMAALSATQAAAMNAQLRFSRQNEQEADRIGMQTMVAAGEDPYAVPEMFEQMLKATRFSRRPPEFLLTHPVTERRIADAMNRASRYPKKQYPQHLDFFLMKARVEFKHAKTPQDAVKRFQSELEGDSLSPEASRYGLVLALTKTGQLDMAQIELNPLLDKYPEKEAIVLAYVGIAEGREQYGEAIARLEPHLEKNKNSHPYNVRYAELLMKNGEYHKSEDVLTKYVRIMPNDDYLWYLLAEVHGLAGDIYGVHMARAEYFKLNGIYGQSIQQLQNALKLTKGDYIRTSIIEEKIRQISALQNNSKL